MSNTHRGNNFVKILLGIAAVLTAVMIGRKVMKDTRRRRTQEDY